MSKLKVYGGLTFMNGEQYRTIVATTSKKKACEIVGGSLYHFNNYWSETGNKLEIEVATSQPETIFVAPNDYISKDYKPKDSL